MQLYDMHSHILPGFDDGAKTIDIALSMLNCLKKQGVANVCLTPHFYTNEMSAEDFISSRAESFENFRPYLPDNMNIVLGTEVYVTRYLFSNDDLSGLTYGKSNYILTEFAYNSSFSKKTMEYINNLIDIHGLIPVLPHIERYHTLINDPALIRELKNMGVIMQTNISNYVKKAPIFKRHKMIKLIGAGLVDILGTDAHSFEHNNPELYIQAIKCISEKCGQRRVKIMMNKSEKIFNAAMGKTE